MQKVMGAQSWMKSSLLIAGMQSRGLNLAFLLATPKIAHKRKNFFFLYELPSNTLSYYYYYSQDDIG